MSKRNRIKTPVKKQANLEEIEAEKQLVKANEIYEDWKRSLLGTPTLAKDLPARLNELAARIEAVIQDKHLARTIVEMINLKIGDTFLAKNVSQFMMKVHALCSNEIQVNNIAMICNWAGDALVNRVNWFKKQARFMCPNCKGLIHQKSMKEIKTIVN